MTKAPFANNLMSAKNESKFSPEEKHYFYYSGQGGQNLFSDPEGDIISKTFFKIKAFLKGYSKKRNIGMYTPIEKFLPKIFFPETSVICLFQHASLKRQAQSMVSATPRRVSREGLVIG